MHVTTIYLHTAFRIAPVDPRVFGGFLEHMGRAVYEGVYDPTSTHADADGFRMDVLDALRRLRFTVMRYPGGNFVSGYHWEDGIGPRDKRPLRIETAWDSQEPNQVGTDEFMSLCRKMGWQPMLAVNLGSGTPEEARNWVEYCNGATSTKYGDLRAANGHPEPYGVKLWCLGNEMDGPWQMQAKTAAEYGRIATEAAKLMRWVDPDVELVACGSSGFNMPTFGSWEQTVLEHCFEHVEAISLHLYVNDYAGDSAALLASADLMDGFIERVAAIADGVAARRGSSKRLALSFDEWNVWYRTRRRQQDRTQPGWPEAPPILEELYSLQDALAFGGMCISLLNHADRVKIACLAQLVNVIAPIMTETGGAAWRQTIFYPFAQFSRFGRGTVLRTEFDSPGYATRYYDPRGAAELWYPLTAAYLKLAAVHDEDGGTLTLFALNRHLTQELTLEVAAGGFGALEVLAARQLCGPDLDATNTRPHPDRVKPEALAQVRITRDGVQATLAPASWNVIRLRVAPPSLR